MRRKTILVYFVTWPAVGHAVEALRHSLGYALANPGSEIRLVLNSQTSVELADLCPWISGTYTLDTTPEAPFDPGAFGHIPKEWDYVAYDRRVYSEPSWRSRAGVYDRYRAHARHVLRARIAAGGCSGPTIPYRRQAPLRLDLPEESVSFARRELASAGIHVALVPAGGGAATSYPSLASWIRIVDGLHARFPDLTVELIGKLKDEGHPNTTAFSRSDLAALLERYPFCRDRFDIGITNQLAVAQRCSLLIAPHTGFAFAVLAVGTPWLAISGGRWREFFHVGVPFYSVLPDPSRYPAFDEAAFDRLVVDRDGSERIASMCEDRVEEDLPEILDAAQILAERRWSFDDCLRHHDERWTELYESRLLHLAATRARPLLGLARRVRDEVRARRHETEARRHAAALWAAR